MFAALTGALALQTAALGQPRGGRAGRQASVRVSPASARNNILEAREAFLQEGSFLTTKPLCFVRNLSNFPSSCARCCQPRGQHRLLQNQKQEVGSSRRQCWGGTPGPAGTPWHLQHCPARARPGNVGSRLLSHSLEQEGGSALSPSPVSSPCPAESWQQRGTPLCSPGPVRRSPPGSAASSAAPACSGATRARVSRETAGHLRKRFSLLEILDLGQI